MTYYVGHVKRNAETGDVALRTMFEEGQTVQLDNMAWLVATANIGARHTNTAEVDTWDDLYVAEQPGS